MKLKDHIDGSFDEALENIIKIINIKTIKSDEAMGAPFGVELKIGLERTLEIAKNLGFRVKNLDNYIGYAEVGQGDDYIAILGHIDVVPEGDEKGWSVPPYKGVIRDNQLIARGALDNKSPIISVLYSLKAVLDAYPAFNKRVRVIFGTNEESGDEDIRYYLKQEKPPKYAFTPDGRFPVIFSEKGIYTFSFKEKIDLESSRVIKLEAGSKSNIVPEICKAEIKGFSEPLLRDTIKIIEKKSNCLFGLKYLSESMEVTCEGKSAHASSPQRGINAILGMFKLLNSILPEKDSLKNFFRFIDTYIGETSNGEKLGIMVRNEEMGDLTINAGITNIINGEVFIKFNVRYPASITESELDTKLGEVAKRHSIIFFKRNHNKPLYFDKSHSLVKTLQQVYKEVTGRDEEPAALGGGTYAKLMPNTVAFGPNFKEYRGNPHSFDESIDLSMLKQGMEIYARAIIGLSKLI